MNTHHQRGVAHILMLAVLVLVALSVLARCDVEAQAGGLTPHQEQHHGLETNRCRCGNNPARPATH